MELADVSDLLALLGSIISIITLLLATWEYRRLKKIRDKHKLDEATVEGATKAYYSSKSGWLKFLYAFLGASLSITMAVLELQVKDIDKTSKDREREVRSKTIVGLMMGEKMDQSVQVQLWLLLAFLVNLAFSTFSGVGFSGVVLFVIAVWVLAIRVDHSIIEYRIAKGWYGKNEFESREIIRFIMRHANKEDFNDHDGLKKVLPEATQDAISDFNASRERGVCA